MARKQDADAKVLPNANMAVELWPIERVLPYEKNARVIPQRAIDKVAASIEAFGFRQPIVVEANGTAIVGHVRRLAALQLGLEQVPVHVATDLTAAQIRAYRLADNRTHDEASWDDDLLRLEFAELKGLDLDLSFTGFELSEIEKLLKSSEADDERANEAPALPEHPVSRLGDMWVLGNHRILCGDSTTADDVARLLGGEKPGLMVTDPPYGVELDPEWRQASGLQKHTRQSGKVKNDDRAEWTEAYRLFPGDVAYVWHASLFAIEVGLNLREVQFDIRACIIWAKQALQISRGAYHWQHEPCWYAVRKGATANWCGDRKQSTIWQIANLNGNGNRDEAATGHGTQKPIDCMRRPILNHTKRGDSVYDPFLGSGTTLIAAEQTERFCYGLEIDPKYCDVIVKRWQTFTGKLAGLAEDGRTFEQVEADRMEQVNAA